MKRIFYIFILILLTCNAYATDLYNGGSNTLSDQGWLYLENPLFSSDATISASGGSTILDTTTTISDQAGFFTHIPGSSTPVHPLMQGVTLDRSTGYTLDFGLQVTNESHLNNDRAGFSIIALSSDLMGIELGFWNDEIWAQSDILSDGALFTHAESTGTFDVSSLIDYSLSIYADTYTLFAGSNPILTGALRDYSSFGAPYTTANLIFFGDDTSSASATSSISHITLTQSSSPVPEPGSVLLCLMGAVYYFSKKRDKKST